MDNSQDSFHNTKDGEEEGDKVDDSSKNKAAAVTAVNNDNSLQAYLFGEVDDRERLNLQHDIYKSYFQKMLKSILYEYGVASRLTTSPLTPFQVLDIGCGEGLFLQDVGTTLLADGFFKSAVGEKLQLVGIDRDNIAIEVAEALALELPSPLPAHLHFLNCDVTTSLEECLGLQSLFHSHWSNSESPLEPLRFDLILGLLVFEHIANAKQHLKNVYDNYLALGGIIYLQDTATAEGPNGWVAPHPIMVSSIKAATRYIDGVNAGINVAQAQADWLREWGAEILNVELVTTPANNDNGQNRLVFRNLVMAVRNFGPVLVKQGIITQTEFESQLATMYAELNITSRGQTSVVATLARKPTI